MMLETVSGISDVSESGLNSILDNVTPGEASGKPRHHNDDGNRFWDLGCKRIGFKFNNRQCDS